MADRYLRASGDWTGAVWAATSGGTAGSAATPTASDNVYISANYTVTLAADASCLNIYHTAGTLSLSSYKLSVGQTFESSGLTARTINLDSGTIHCTAQVYGTSYFYLSGSNLTFNAGTSLIILDGGTQYNTSEADNFIFDTLSKTFNDVRINLNDTPAVDFVSSLNISGSPTFRLLDIRSANTSAHTVNFDGSIIPIHKFIAIGSSGTNRLSLTTSNAFYTALNIQPGGTSYGQYLDISSNVINEYNSSSGWASAYIGANSIDSSETWVTQDPPKISTLVDPLTTAPASNTNYTVTGTINQLTTGSDGGGYEFASSTLVSNDTYDLVDSSLILEVLGGEYGTGEMLFKALSDTWAGVYMSGSPLLYEYDPYTGYGDSTEIGVTLPTYIKISLSSSTRVLSISVHDGTSWATTYAFQPMPVEDVALWRSGRLTASGINAVMPGTVKLQIGYINPTVAVEQSSTGNMLMLFM